MTCLKNGGIEHELGMPLEITSLIKMVCLQQKKNYNNPQNITLNNSLINQEYVLTTLKIEYEDIYGNSHSELFRVTFKTYSSFSNSIKYNEEKIVLTFKKDK